MFRIVSVIAFVATLQCISAECDITKCSVPKHYRELGCKPIFADGDEEKCCPVKYDCEELMKQDATKCHFRGKTYEQGDSMDEQAANCRAACRCRDGDFTCAHVECPELVFNRPEPHCVIQNSRSKCCSEKIICEKEEIEKLQECYLDGKQYRLGQTMYPNDHRCFSCICDEKFDNSTVITKNPSCAEVDCAIDLTKQTSIRSGCVPVYYGEPTCCPISTKCRKYRADSSLGRSF